MMRYSSTTSNIDQLPLQEKVTCTTLFKRASDLTILLLLFSLLAYRILHVASHERLLWVLAFLCESWFTFVWLLVTNGKWNIAENNTYPERLLVRSSLDLPPVDIFVTTADSTLEPPAITVNTVLSLMAVDYPANKLACYVSDDGGSAVTFYSLLEASKFAKFWVPFCKKHKVVIRAPSIYFSTSTTAHENFPPQSSSSDFAQEWRVMKEEYMKLSRKIGAAVENITPFLASEELADFRKIKRGNHPSIVKVMIESEEDEADGLPHLIYVAREKRPKCSHHFKAGAMNVLTRVSGVMTNAPFMLNVDCDMFANNPQILLHAMCILLGCKSETDSGFVQFPQHFHGGIRDDPFGNSLPVLQAYMGRGIAGLQGPFYGGTGCIHRRKIIYGQHPLDDHQYSKEEALNLVSGKYSDWDKLRKKLGPSPELVQLAAQTLWGGGDDDKTVRKDISSRIPAAMEVADTHYEMINKTEWGQEVGWVYGSATEDVLTGLKIHSMGWKSFYCTPEPPGFLGSAPDSCPISLKQMKRWSTGVAEILFSRCSPLLCTLNKKLQFRQCLSYTYLCIWGLRSVPELCYSLLPAYCLLTNSSFLPKVDEPAVLIPGLLCILYHLYTLQEYLACGLTVRNWWNNTRMTRIISTTAWLFGFISAVAKFLGLSETMFEITKKEHNVPSTTTASGSGQEDDDPGRFTFDESSLFVPGVALVFIHLVALSVGLWSGQWRLRHGEVICTLWLLVAFLPFIKGLVRSGCYGIPWTIVFKGTALASLFMFCARISS